MNWGIEVLRFWYETGTGVVRDGVESLYIASISRLYRPYIAF